MGTPSAEGMGAMYFPNVVQNSCCSLEASFLVYTRVNIEKDEYKSRNAYELKKKMPDQSFGQAILLPLLFKAKCNLKDFIVFCCAQKNKQSLTFRINHA